MEENEMNLTIDHVKKMMNTIRPGDKISFDSIAACDSPGQICRNPSATIPAVGTVVKVYPRYALVRLKVPVECVPWHSIHKLNGRPWPLFCDEGASRNA